MGREAHSGSGTRGMSKRGEVKPDGESDSEAFRAAMRDVRPLAPAKVRAPASAPRRRKGAPRRAAAAGLAELAAQLPLLSSESGATVSPEETLLYRRAGVREQLVRRLRRGLLPREAQLDLHGMTQASARAEMLAFLDAARARGLRCVQIIHGKGARSSQRGAVLKSALNEWLRRHPDVMAFSSARPLDGGTGAAYVLLRA